MHRVIDFGKASVVESAMVVTNGKTKIESLSYGGSSSSRGVGSSASSVWLPLRGQVPPSRSYYGISCFLKLLSHCMLKC